MDFNLIFVKVKTFLRRIWYLMWLSGNSILQNLKYLNKFKNYELNSLETYSGYGIYSSIRQMSFILLNWIINYKIIILLILTRAILLTCLISFRV
jgi:hypothetical protein